MTDNRTTELLRYGLTERGIEWRSGLEGVTFVGDWCFVEYDNGKLAATCEPVLTPEQAIAATLGTEINGDTSDGYHTFNELYHHRAVLFSVIVRDHRELAWKANKHHDGTMYDGMFIVGIETPKGQATYHYDIDPYWAMFDCEEREFAPEWDGHTPDEAISRIAELGSEPPYDELIRYLENDWNISASWDGLRKFWCIELTEEGVKLRDAVHGTLTAEQVREAIEANSWAETSSVREFNDSSWQAIADELNAELGSDTSAARLAERLRSIADEMRNVGASSMKPHELLACYAREVDKVADSLKFAATLGNGTCRNEWAEFGKFRCSECWTQVNAISTNTTAPIPIKYCPKCGAKVVG